MCDQGERDGLREGVDRMRDELISLKRSNSLLARRKQQWLATTTRSCDCHVTQDGGGISDEGCSGGKQRSRHSEQDPAAPDSRPTEPVSLQRSGGGGGGGVRETLFTLCLQWVNWRGELERQMRPRWLPNCSSSR